MSAYEFYKSKSFDFFEKLFFQLLVSKKDKYFCEDFFNFGITLFKELEYNNIYINAVIDVFYNDFRYKRIAQNYLKFSLK